MSDGVGMVTNVLALPLAVLEIETGTNEDWVDGVLYLIDTDDLTGPQLDLRGINFAMHVRRAPPENEVVIEATTENQMLQIGAAPDFGFLIIFVPWTLMRDKVPGAYVGDVVAMDGLNRRRFIEFSLNIVHGVTRAEGVKALERREGLIGVADVRPEGVTWISREAIEKKVAA